MHYNIAPICGSCSCQTLEQLFQSSLVVVQLDQIIFRGNQVSELKPLIEKKEWLRNFSQIFHTTIINKLTYSASFRDVKTSSNGRRLSLEPQTTFFWMLRFRKQNSKVALNSRYFCPNKIQMWLHCNRMQHWTKIIKFRNGPSLSIQQENVRLDDKMRIIWDGRSTEC